LTGQGAPALPRSTRFYNGVLFIALDIQKFRNVAEFLAEAREYADIVRANPARDGYDGVLIPGDPERHSAAARTEAIRLDDNTWLQIGEVAERYGVAVPTI
ncbi:MAG: Ldh family oxidoreductase, partial [Anaerolineales bacterium]|nr:Ldh family oxidoreductase [Anaerolineales bacterium]